MSGQVPLEYPSSTPEAPIEYPWSTPRAPRSTPAVPCEYPEYSEVPPGVPNAPVLPQVAVDVQTRREVLAGGLERMADGDEAVSTQSTPVRDSVEVHLCVQLSRDT